MHTATSSIFKPSASSSRPVFARGTAAKRTDEPAPGTAGGLHLFNESLEKEAARADQAELLFAPDRVEDVSKVKTEQKNGNDFFLHLVDAQGQPLKIRCENKFEGHTSGRVALEWVSLDRPALVAGWMATSKAAWLFSWYHLSGDVLAMPLQDARDLVSKNPFRHSATTALNKNYLSWNTLESLDYLLASIPDARVLDLRYELGFKPERASMVKGASLKKRCTVEELKVLMARRHQDSVPLSLGTSQLQDLVRGLQPLNRSRHLDTHAKRISALPWLKV